MPIKAFRVTLQLRSPRVTSKQLKECEHRYDDALILPHSANPHRMGFSGTTTASALVRIAQN
jgi:hypothetical protein